MSHEVPSLENFLPTKDRSDIAALVRTTFNLGTRFIAGLELDSLRQTYTLPCGVKQSIGCVHSPCTSKAVVLDGSVREATCLAGLSWGFIPANQGTKTLAYLQVGPYFADESRRHAFTRSRPELAMVAATWPTHADAPSGALSMLADWLDGMVRQKVDFRERSKAETMLLFLVDSTKSIASMVDHHELLNYLTDVSAHLTDAKSGFIMSVDDRTRELRITAARGVSSDFNRSLKIPVGRGVTGRVAASGQALYVPDTAKDTNYIASGYRAGSELAVPIRSDDRLVGVLVVDSMEKHHFTEFHQRVLESLASQVGNVILGLRQEQDAKSKLRQLQTLHSVTSAINSTLSLDAVLETVLEHLGRAFQSAGCTLSLVEGNRASLMIRSAESVAVKTVRDVPVSSERGILGHVMRERRPLLLQDGDGGLFEQFRETISSDVSSILVAPLINKGEFLGTVSISSAVRYTKGDLDLLATVAGQVSQAISKARLFERSQRQVAELSLINELGKAINSSLDLDNVLDYLVNMLSSVVEAESGSLMLFDKDGQTLRIVCSKGLDAKLVAGMKFELGSGVAGWVAANRKPVLLEDGAKDPRYVDGGAGRTHFSMMCAPLMAKEKVVGVISFERPLGRKKAFTGDDLELLSTLAAQAGMAVANAKLYQNLVQVHFETIQSLANALEAKDQYTHGHSRRVSKDSVRIAQKLNLDAKEVEVIRHAALLHDIGKIGVRDGVLLKAGRLNDEEYSHIKRHAALGASILSSVAHLRGVSEMVRHHHEKLDGTGYPARLKGEDIPLGSRIIGICDAFDAMITTRPYREGMPIEAAVRELVAHKGTQFDPRLVDLFVEILVEHHPSLDLTSGTELTPEVARIA